MMLQTGATLILALAINAAASGAPMSTSTPIVLACDLPSPVIGGAAGARSSGQRVFRIAPGQLQEWSPLERKFGGNYCSAFGCSSSADRTEGTVGSASVSFTIGFDHARGVGYWRAIGATGFRTNEGVCRRIADPSLSQASP